MGSKLYTRGERIFKWVSLVLLLVICVATLAPFVLILASSLTDETTLITYGYSFWPQKFSMDSYLYMWNQRKQIGRSYLTSLGITAVGTVVSLLFTTMLAYPMSRKDFKYSNQLSLFLTLCLCTKLFFFAQRHLKTFLSKRWKSYILHFSGNCRLITLPVLLFPPNFFCTKVDVAVFLKC